MKIARVGWGQVSLEEGNWRVFRVWKFWVAFRLFVPI